MQDEHFVGMCAASDLAARLQSELHRALGDLAAAEAAYRAAADYATTGPASIPLGIRRDVATCRRRLAALRQVLDDLHGPDGGCHAASA
ncbi:MAG: hypothetical protein JNK49_17515 [Planctomycetes bacterium]|nr:hypothetical protein [Planctomycetota bacterium]